MTTPVLRTHAPYHLHWLLLAIVLFGAACGQGTPTVPPGTPETPVITPALETAQPSLTPEPPSPTPQPLAARVNGQALLLEDYEAELLRYQLAAGAVELDETQRSLVLDTLIGETLLAQAALENGYQPDPADLAARLQGIISAQGGEEAFQGYLQAQHYTMLSFQRALETATAAAWMRDQLAASLPEQLPQVRAQQILLYNSSEAQQALDQLNGGTEFATLAAQVDPVSAGELGWFPQGYLLEPAIEQAAFSLQPGQHSQIIETRLGFHIIFIIERQEARPLEAEARLVLQTQVVQRWLDERRQQSQIEILRP